MLRPEDCVPGTLVECIDDTDWNDQPVKSPRVRRGVIYTIDALVCCLPDEFDPDPYGVELREVHDDIVAWPLRIFRLLPDERLSIFRQMLAPVPTKETV
jgi:hypothetical protein